MPLRNLRIAAEKVRDEGAKRLKVEFEAEGATSLDARQIASIATEGGLGLVIKIGGCEAVRDIRESLELGADSIVAPMIESPFAAAKFTSAVKLEATLSGTPLPQLAINIESATGISALPTILKDRAIDQIERIVLGRTDLIASLGLAPKEVDGEIVAAHARRTLRAAREAGLLTTLGGTVTSNSIRFIDSLDGLVDNFETRKVVFSKRDVSSLPRAIDSGLRFELAWLEFKTQELGEQTTKESRRKQILAERLAL